LAAVAWQKRHMGSTSTKPTRSGIEFGKQSNIGFSGEAANEGVPREKEFKLMQNHVKRVGQRTEEQEDRKMLEERLAQQEAELIAFRPQGAIVLQR
ncbi:MAG TPA: hypothetical protein VNK03_01035, partial [Gammaproteobacteria bacterium]|nr:hypothetical protein [Gammaproteobacteria bacterium]